ncbi:unnamed protein product [Sympodiomycopsis kandeliae]
MGLVSGYDSGSGPDSDSEHESELPTQVKSSGLATNQASSSSSKVKANGLSSSSAKLNGLSSLLLPPQASPSSAGKSNGSSSPQASSSSKPSGLSSLLLLPPPQSSSSSKSNSLSKALPPPTTTSKRKHQIKISTNSTSDDSDGDDQVASTHKKPKPTTTTESTTSGSKHSLFAMLPAPSRPNPQPTKEEEEEEGQEAKLSITEDTSTSKSGKGNADFRAMLGLKPVANRTSSRDSTPPKPTISSRPTTTNDGKQKEQPKPVSIPAARPDPKQDPQEEVDFFSIGSDQKRVSLPTLSANAISAAPTITEDHSAYPGWQQNPDGSWIAITPEAQAQAQASASAHTNGNDSVDARARLIRRLQEEEGIDVDSLQSVDLATLRSEWEKKPVEARSSSTTLDAKYAQAAGQPLQEEQRQSKEKDKRTNFRARQKGQLTSLFAQAEERRDELEDKWAQGKQNKRAAASRYGF